MRLAWSLVTAWKMLSAPVGFAGDPTCGGVSFSNTLRVVGGSATPYSKYYPDTGINGLFGFDAQNNPILLKQSIWAGDARTNFNTEALSDAYKRG